MSSRIGGSRRKSRHKFKKEIRQRGKVSITKYLQKFKLGDRVCLDVEPAIQKGLYPARFVGKIGTIKKESGRCYGVAIRDGGKKKLLIVHPVHLKKA